MAKFRSKLSVWQAARVQSARSSLLVNVKGNYGLEKVFEEYNSFYPIVPTGKENDPAKYQLIEREAYFDKIRTYANLVEDGLAGQIASMMDYVRRNLIDPRDDDMKVTYPLDVLMIIITLAFCRGIWQPKDIVEFYRFNYPELFLLVPGIPRQQNRLCVSTVNLLLRSLNADDVHNFFKFYFSTVKYLIDEQVTYKGDLYKERPDYIRDTLAFDGQKLKASNKKGEPNRRCKYHSITLFNCTQSIPVLYQIGDKKNQEKRIALEFFFDANLCGNVVMCDALNAKGDVSKKIIEAEGHYLFGIKQNCNKELLDHVQAIFNRQERDAVTFEVTQDKPDHGRRVYIKYQVLDANKYLDKRFKHDYVSLNTLVKYTKISEYIIDGKVTKKTTRERIYLSSLPFDDEKTINQVRASIEDYWFIEEHHSVIDDERILNQDNLCLTSPRAVANRVGFNKIAYSYISYMRQRFSIEQELKVPLAYDTTLKYIQRMSIHEQFLSLFDFVTKEE